MGAVLNLEFERHRLHALQRGELLWFVLADVCEIFDINDVSDVAERLDEDQKGRVSIPTLGGPQRMLIVSEDAVYEIACTSRKPIAKRFKRWLYREVLPEIRRTGSYRGGSAPLDTMLGSIQPELALTPDNLRDDNVIRLIRDEAWKQGELFAESPPRFPTIVEWRRQSCRVGLIYNSDLPIVSKILPINMTPYNVSRCRTFAYHIDHALEIGYSLETFLDNLPARSLLAAILRGLLGAR